MYRFASLYAFGKLTNRTPVVLETDKVLRKMESEVGQLFPNFYKKIYFIVGF